MMMSTQESAEEKAASHKAQPLQQTEQNRLVESEIEKVLSSYEKNFKIPSSVMEARYMNQWNQLPEVPDSRMKFIDALMKHGKIPESLYTKYEEQCKQVADEILAGVAFDDEMEIDSSLSVDQQLQRSLDKLREDVLKHHTDTASTSVLPDLSYVPQLNSISEKIMAVQAADTPEPINPGPSAGAEAWIIETGNLSTENCNFKAAQMLFNTIGEIVTSLLNLSLPQCNASWLTQLLRMLRSHMTLLHTFCCVFYQLITRQPQTLSECHAHALAAILVHWTKYTDCTAGIRLRRPTSNQSETTTLVSYIVDSLPVSTTSEASFTLLFSVAYIFYAQMIGLELTVDERRSPEDVEPMVHRSADEVFTIPPRIKELVSYLGPKLVKELRPHTSTFGSEISVSTAVTFPSLPKFLSNSLVRGMVEQNRISFESWVWHEMEVMDADLGAEWLDEYYSWVVFTRWHEQQSVPTDGEDPQAYIVGLLQTLARAVLEADTRWRLPSRCNCHSKHQRSNRSQANTPSNIFNLLQKLSQMHGCDTANNNRVPWMWSVMDQYITSSGQSHESQSGRITRQAKVVAFFRLLAQLPSTVMVLWCRSPSPKVNGLIQLCGAINTEARSICDTFALPSDLTLHLITTLANLPLELNDNLKHLLLNCPLITLSAMHHRPTTTNAFSLICCTNAIKDMFEAIAVADDGATALLNGAEVAIQNSLPAWLQGAALWSRLSRSQYSISVLQLTLEGSVTEALLHCMTLEMAAGMLRGEDNMQVLEEATLTTWWSHIDALHCLSDYDDENSKPATAFRRCVPDSLQRLQILVCLRLFVRAVNGDLSQLVSLWSVTRTLRWYAGCVQLFDNRTCDISAVMSTLQQVSPAICQFAAAMTNSQIACVDRAALDAVDPHIRMAFKRLQNV